jgi:hypothetical protein
VKGIPDGEKLEYNDPEWKSVLTFLMVQDISIQEGGSCNK